MDNKYVYIDTYGCSANQNNSEILAGLLIQSGYKVTNNKEIADVFVINSCVVKNKTEDKIKRKIQNLKNNEKLTIVTGCMANTDNGQINKLNPRVFLLKTDYLKSIVKLIKDYDSKLFITNNYILEEKNEKILLPKMSLNKLISITQISEGCLSRCSFCKTKLAKGNLYSYPMEKIVSSIENDLVSGSKEVWITSQGNACYGIDRGKRELPELLKKILSLEHDFKLRLGMMHPYHLYPILNELIEIYKNDKMYKFLHIPIQSASDKVLKDMKRNHEMKIVEQIIDRFKTEFPDAVISTDMITGYPIETDYDHQKNLDFINKYRPDVLNLSKFSKHKGTEAEKFEELSIEIINKRNSELMRAHRNMALENKRKFLKKEIKIFVNKNTFLKNIYEARDDNYNIILIKSDDRIIGKNLQVKIEKIGAHHMIGEIV